MLLKKLCVLLVILCFFSLQVLPADIYLTEQEFMAIKTELQRMSAATTQLKNELNASQEQSSRLLEMSEKLRQRLELALAMLEESEKSLEASQAELTALLTELAELRMEYSALWESWMQQKNETQRWKRVATVGWISAGLVLISGIAWGVVK